MYKNCIRVYCRLKPNFDENPLTCIKYQVCQDTIEENEYEILVIHGKPSLDFINNKPDTYSFRFHKVFNEETKQEKIYDVVAKPVIEGVMQGFNGTIFAYGQTGSGKTFTISGITAEQSSEAIVHRSMKQIFQSLSQTPVNSYFIDISYMEIYNEIGCDLLSERTDRRIILQEDEDGEIQLRNLSMHHVRNYEEFLELYRIGENNRSESSTILNQYSSRSHCILTIYLAMRIPDSQHYQKSKLHLVDLAGSERFSKFGHPYQTLVEARHINLSLHYLEQVIVALGEKHRLHIPYRNSVMTTVLRDSLGGNCLTTMIATLSTDFSNLSETLSTCRFAQRVALVRNEIRKNLIDDSTEIDLIKSEFQSLKNQMSESSFKTALSGFKKKVNQNLSEEESLECQNFVDNFISGRNSFSKVISPMIKNPDKIRACFEMLKSVIIDVQRKRKKAEQQAHFMYQRVLGSKQDGEFLKSSKSCVLSNSSLFPKSSISIITSSENTEITNNNSFIQSSESELTGCDINQKITEMKMPETCAHHKCVPSEIFEAKMNTLVNVIEECKEVHKQEINKLDSIKKLVIDDVTLNYNNFSDIVTKINKEKLSKLKTTKTESLSSIDNTDCDNICKSRDYNKEILLTFDGSNKYMKSEQKCVVSKDDKYDNEFENTEKLNVGFKCNSRGPQIKSKKCLQTIATECKNPTSIFKTRTSPRYSRKNPNCCNDKLNTCSEPIVKCYEMTEDLSGQDKNSHTKLNIGHKSQQYMTTEAIQRAQQKGKFNTITRKLSPKRSILTNHRSDLKDNVDFQNAVSVSHYEGDSLRKKLPMNETKKYVDHPTANGNTIEFKNFSMKNCANVMDSSPYNPTCSEECCITNAVNNWRSLNEAQNYCCTHISNSEKAVEKNCSSNDNSSRKISTNQYRDFSEITTNKNSNKITENRRTLSNKMHLRDFSTNKSSNQSKMLNRRDNNNIGRFLNSNSNKTVFQSNEEEFSNFETDDDDVVFSVLNPKKMESKFDLLESTSDSFSMDPCNLNYTNSTQKLDDTLPLTGDPDVDEEIIRFYQKQINYRS